MSEPASLSCSRGFVRSFRRKGKWWKRGNPRDRLPSKGEKGVCAMVTSLEVPPLGGELAVELFVGDELTTLLGERGTESKLGL